MILKLPHIGPAPGPAPGPARGLRNHISAIEDIMPTLLDLANVATEVEFDGVSLVPALMSADAQLPSRDLFFQFHRGSEPDPYRNIAVLRGDYKLVQPVGRGAQAFARDSARFELYNLAQDPNETTDLAADYPAYVNTLVEAYDSWFADTRLNATGQQVIWMGDERQNPVTLTLQRQILSSEMEARIEEIELAKGPVRLKAWVTIDGQDNGFEFIEIERLDE